MKISIIIPVYNEIKTINEILRKILLKSKINKEIIIVDDGSQDGTEEFLKKINFKDVKKIIFHKKNLGKGAAIQSASKFVSGDYIMIQDADLEYDPNDYDIFIRYALKKKPKAVYGSRVLGRAKDTKLVGFLKLFRIFANFMLTLISNLINDQKLTDAHTCYKFIDKKIFLKLNLQEKGFAICSEITTKLSKLNITIDEVPISYEGRSYKEGKKIRAIDAISSLIAILKYKYFF